jgi:hypothetical protein
MRLAGARNHSFFKDVSKRLKAEDYLVKRAPVEHSNVDFANRLCAGAARPTVLLANDGQVDPQTVALNKNVK